MRRLLLEIYTQILILVPDLFFEFDSACIEDKENRSAYDLVEIEEIAVIVITIIFAISN